ncbi:hypothetical protein [Flavobacterium frigoris]|uniref:Uncharacterized protein n=1 Tax=Flavobacterium frigoris (strain PS1) TaxID=1086011 RepID=H7FRH9_FLAFP|nr:hypothetical protein [Flavobacterium frigoris]EIA08962.1 hypothetical protein HJ01_01728 [Flavobacterium frigoris PS1]
MKITITTIFAFLTMFAYGQNMSNLKELGNNETIPTGQAVIYGNFIQRLGFSSGGFPQDIKIINIETKELYTFRVKPTFKSAKENTFCYTLKPGTYAISNYLWTQSKWYGAKMVTEPVFKNIDATDQIENKINTGKLKEIDFVPFTFTVTENTLNYLGTWHFDTGLVKFTNDKQVFDIKIIDKYKKLDLATAKIVLPN